MFGVIHTWVNEQLMNKNLFCKNQRLRVMLMPMISLAIVPLILLMPGTGIKITHANAPFPSWWGGKTCDTNNYPGSYTLGASYNGVIACGPGPTQGGSDHAVHFFSGAWGEYEWECTELVFRYMYLVYGIAPYSANGKDVVNNYTGNVLTKVSNNGTSLPTPGDILSEAGTGTNPNGHTAVVTAVTSSKVTIMQQNASSNGWGYISVANNVLGSRVTGWLHNPSSHSSSSAHVAALQYNSEMDVFKLGGDGAIWKDTWQPANNAWSGWNSLGGVLASDPVAIKFNSEMDVFARSPNGQVVKDTWNGSSWSGWNSLGGTMVGTPAAVQYGSTEMDVYARATNNQIYKDTWNGSSWSGWNSLGGSIAGNPTAMIYGGSEMDVWARGTDGTLYKDGWNGSSWGGFTSQGQAMTGDPVAIQYYSEMDVYVNTFSGELFKRTWNGSSWSSWVGMPGGTFAGSPAALQYNSEMDVYARGANDSHIYKDTWQPSNNSWSGWNSLGGNEAGDPTAIQYSTEMDVYATNYANNTDKDTWLPANNNWSGFTALL